LQTYPEALSLRAKADLEAMGVKVMTGKKVTDVNESGVQIGDQFIACKNIIWAAGNQASPLLKTLGCPLDRSGRVLVEPDLSIPDYSNIFVIGDAACVLQNEKPIPATAPAAIQEGKYVAELIKHGIPKEQRRPYCYFDKGNMATIGKAKAIVIYKSLQLSGFFAWLIWAFVHIIYLIGFRSRLGVMLEWFSALVTGQRGVRLITRPIDTPK
jgi:NADH dehydrogenase